MQPVIGPGASLTAIVLGGSLAGAPPPSAGALDPPAWLAGSYEGSVTAVEAPAEPGGLGFPHDPAPGTAAGSRPAVRVAVSFLVLPEEGGATKRVVLVCTAPQGPTGGPSPGGGDVVLRNLVGAASSPGEGEDLSSEEGFLLPSLAPSFFPASGIPSPGDAEREEEIQLSNGAIVTLPIRTSAVRAGSLLTETRVLAAGSSAPVEIDGPGSAVERWSETRVVDLDRRAVERIRREERIVPGREGNARESSVEMGLGRASVLGEASRARASQLAQGVEAILAAFREKKHPREIYDLIKALPAREPPDLLPGLEEALASKLGRYRMAREAAARKKAAPPIEVAPDFTLESLDGRKVSFKEATNGKVTLLAFWGYGCPPCRVEGPYLTRLQKIYGERGFTVLAVNAYDEPRDLVQAFVERARLEHPILLMGKAVARDLYRVNRYPTSVWIDRAGKVVHRESGFSPASFPRIEARVKEMLEKADHPDR